MGSRLTWPEICRNRDLRGRWVALDECKYDPRTAQPTEGTVVDADEDAGDEKQRAARGDVVPVHVDDRVRGECAETDGEWHRPAGHRIQALAANLVAGYEGSRPDLVSVILDDIIIDRCPLLSPLGARFYVHVGHDLSPAGTCAGKRQI